MANDSRPAKKRKLDFSDEHKVIVGLEESQKTYTVARQVLTQSSEFFKRACKSAWKEGQTKTIELPEADPAAFDIYLQLLYTGEVVTLEEDVPPATESSDSARAARSHHTKAIINTYLLADMLMDLQSKNILADDVAKQGDKYLIVSGMADLVFRKTTSVSPLRRLLVDIATYMGINPYYEEYLAEYPHQFVVNLALANMKLVKAGKPAVAPWEVNPCTYHEHDDANPKCE